MDNNVIMNGIPWFDDEGEIVNAHGICLVEDDGIYYLFGEYKTDDVNKFMGFGCYSSPDLSHWHFEGKALAVQPDGIMGPDRIGERPKVMKCPKTGAYMMFMHADDMSYMDPCVGVAMAKTITGPYEMIGALPYKGKPIHRWDIGSFQDDDGTGYLLTHEGDIYRLADDYLGAEELVAHDIAEGGESPAMFRHGDTYYIMFSGKTSWGSNDNHYMTAPAPCGPWTDRGLFAPEGSCTHDSQCSFVFPLKTDQGTVPMYCGDRWSFPHQASAASQVWLPLKPEGGRLAMDEFWTSWNPMTVEPQELAGEHKPLVFRSDATGTALEVPFTGTRIALYGKAAPRNAYARIEIIDHDGVAGSGAAGCGTGMSGVAGSGAIRSSQYVTFYSPVESEGLRYMSPVLARGSHTLRITVTGDKSEWFFKSGRRAGCDGVNVDVTGALVID